MTNLDQETLESGDHNHQLAQGLEHNRCFNICGFNQAMDWFLCLEALIIRSGSSWSVLFLCDPRGFVVISASQIGLPESPEELCVQIPRSPLQNPCHKPSRAEAVTLSSGMFSEGGSEADDCLLMVKCLEMPRFYYDLSEIVLVGIWRFCLNSTFSMKPS